MSPTPRISPPTRAFVLCAGFGTRLRPFTRTTPKPLAPLWGVPLVQRVCDALAAWGVQEVLLNLHHLPDPLREWAKAHSTPSFAIRTILEPDILGTAGALRNAAENDPDFFSAPLWVVNGDIAFLDVRPNPFLRALAASPEAAAACWLTPAAGPRTVLAPPPGSVITDFRAPAGTGETFCGLQLVRPVFLLPHIAPGFDALPDAYVRAAAAGHPALGVRIPRAFWADLGTPDQLVQAHRDTAPTLAPSPDAPIRLPPAAVLPEPVYDTLAAARKGLGGPFASATVTPLPPRGSSRVFYRWDPNIPDPNAKPRLVCHWSPDRPDNALYGPVTRFLASRRIPVPKLYIDDPATHTLVFEFIEGVSLEELVRKDPARAHYELDAPLKAIVALHRIGRNALRRHASLPPLSPPYDETLAAWERDYYVNAFLRDHCSVSARSLECAAAALDALAPDLLRSPQTLIHRDLQSSNILLRDSFSFHPVFIDYQGLRPGPAAYDLASYVFDPYLEAAGALSDDNRRSLASSYAYDYPDGRKVCDALLPAAAYRLCQALGAYATLSRRPGMARFADYIPPALRLLRSVLSSLPPNFSPILPELPHHPTI